MVEASPGVETFEQVDESVEETVELSFLERSQRRLAAARATLMRPSLRTLFKDRGDRQEYELASAQNREALGLDVGERLREVIDETGAEFDSDEVKQAAIIAVIENKRTIDEMTVSSEYAGKKSSRFISWVREKKIGTKTLLSGASAFIFSGFGAAANIYTAHKLGKHHVADNAESILESDMELTSRLEEQLQNDERPFTRERLGSMAQSSAELMDASIDRERAQVAAQIGPIAVGTGAGLLGNIVGTTLSH